MKFMFLSYKSSVKGYKFWCPKTKKLVIMRDVIFYETSMIQVLAPTNSSVETVQRVVNRWSLILVWFLIQMSRVFLQPQLHSNSILLLDIKR